MTLVRSPNKTVLSSVSHQLTATIATCSQLHLPQASSNNSHSLKTTVFQSLSTNIEVTAHRAAVFCRSSEVLKHDNKQTGIYSGELAARECGGLCLCSLYPSMAELLRRRQRIHFHIISCQVLLALESAGPLLKRAAGVQCHLS